MADEQGLGEIADGPGAWAKHLPPSTRAAWVAVVGVRRRRLDTAAVEVAAIIPLRAGRYRLRRVRCSGSDLKSGLTFLFDPDPDRLVHGGEPSMQRWVQDQDFDTVEEARDAALGRDLPASLESWRNKAAFRSWVQGSEFADLIRPEGERLGVLGWILVGTASLTAFVAPSLAAILLDIDPDSQGSQELLLWILAVMGATAAGFVGYPLADALKGRNLARETARHAPQDGDPADQPREAGPMSRGPSAAGVQDGPSAALAQDVQEDPPGRDVQDTFTRQDD